MPKKKKATIPADVDAEYTQEGPMTIGNPQHRADFLPKPLPGKPKPKKPKAKAKKKKKMRGPKALIKEGVKNYKAADKYFAEKWKQRDLKKQIAKKKKKAQELRDARKRNNAVLYAKRGRVCGMWLRIYRSNI